MHGAFASNFIVTRNGWPSTDQLITQTPSINAFGGFTATYVGTDPAYFFTGVQAEIRLKKNGLPVPAAYADISNIGIYLAYNNASSTINYTFSPLTLSPITGPYQIVETSGLSIRPTDGKLQVSIVMTSAKDIYLICDEVQVVLTVMGTDNTNPEKSNAYPGIITYFDPVLSITPTETSDNLIRLMPAYSEPIALFKIGSNLPADRVTIQMQTSGMVGGYLPVFDGTRIKDGSNNTLATYTGTPGMSAGLLLPVSLGWGATEDITILNDIVGANPNDLVQVTAMLCAELKDGYKTVPGPLEICSNFSQLGRKNIYMPPTAVSDPISDGSLVQVFPNPVIDNFAVSCEGDWDLKIMDVLGNTIMVSVGNNGTKTFDRGTISSGQYFFRIVRGGTYTPPVIKQVVFN